MVLFSVVFSCCCFSCYFFSKVHHVGVPGGVPYPVEFSARALIFAGVVFGFNSKSPRGESTLTTSVPLLPPDGVPTIICVGKRG